MKIFGAKSLIIKYLIQHSKIPIILSNFASYTFKLKNF